MTATIFICIFGWFVDVVQTNFLLTESANANDANKFIRFGRRNSRAFVKDRHTARTAEHKRRTRRRVSINLVPTEHPA